MTIQQKQSFFHSWTLGEKIYIGCQAFFPSFHNITIFSTLQDFNRSEAESCRQMFMGTAGLLALLEREMCCPRWSLCVLGMFLLGATYTDPSRRCLLMCLLSASCVDFCFLSKLFEVLHRFKKKNISCVNVFGCQHTYNILNIKCRHPLPTNTSICIS